MTDDHKSRLEGLFLADPTVSISSSLINRTAQELMPTREYSKLLHPGDMRCSWMDFFAVNFVADQI